MHPKVFEIEVKNNKTSILPNKVDIDRNIAAPTNAIELSIFPRAIMTAANTKTKGKDAMTNEIIENAFFAGGCSTTPNVLAIT